MPQPRFQFDRFIYPWRLEGRTSPFHPWYVLELARTLDGALLRQTNIKAAGGYYALRIRVN